MNIDNLVIGYVDSNFAGNLGDRIRDWLLLFLEWSSSIVE